MRRIAIGLVLLVAVVAVASPIRFYLDGTERSTNLDQGSVKVTRALQNKVNTAQLTVMQTPVGGYYHDPSTLPGVVAWWHMDEASGNLADASGNGLTLTASGSPVYGLSSLAKGYGGTSIRLTGAESFSSTSDSLNVQSGELTVGFWIKFSPGTYGTNNVAVGVAQRFASSAGWSLILNSQDNINFQLNVGNGITNWGGGVRHPVLDDDRRHFVVIQWEDTGADGAIHLYVDGALADSQVLVGASLVGSPSGTTFKIGENSSRYLKAKLDEFFLVDGLLSADVIADLYAQGRSGVEELQLYERAQVTLRAADGTTNRFGGYATEVYPIHDGALNVGWQAVCVGWENRFETILVENYTGVNKTTSAIVSEIFAADSRLSSYDLSGVKTGKVIDGIWRVRDRPLRDVMDELAEVSGMEWWIDANGTDVHMERANTVRTAAIRLSDDSSEIDQSTIFPYYGFDYVRNFYQPVSTVVVRGATTYEDWNPKVFGTLQQAGSNDRYVFQGVGLVPRESESDIIVQRNTGTAQTPVWSSNLVVGKFGKDVLVEDGGTAEVLIQLGTGNNGGAAIIFDESVAPPKHSQNSYRLYGRIAKKVRAVVRDQAAERRLGGRYDLFLKDDKITSVQQATKRAQDEIRLRSRPLETLSMTVDFDPDVAATLLNVGDLLHVKNTLRGIDTYGDGLLGYRVQQLETWMDAAGNLAHHRLTLGTYQKTTGDILRGLTKKIDRMSDFDDDEEDYLDLVSGFEGTEQDTDNVLAFADSVEIVPT